MRFIKVAVLAALCFCLTGCFQIEGFHVLHNYGEADAGSYRISMTELTYQMLKSGSDDKYSKMIDDLGKFSTPKSYRKDGRVFIEDTSGDAKMDHFYDVNSCEKTNNGYARCHFAFKIPDSMAQLSDWSLDWTVVLGPGMRLLDSDHQRNTKLKGFDAIEWSFDGNKVSRGSIDFMVAVPLS